MIGTFLGFLVKSRNNSIVKNIQRFLRKGDRVLDVGAGAGWVAEKLQHIKQAEVTLLDVIDFNQTMLPLKLYDGKTIPFKDNTFDASLLVFMLHHCIDPVNVLKEAVRVSRDRIIVIEDTFTNWFDRIFVCANDFGGNLPTVFLSGFKEKMNLPFAFKKRKEWEAIFRALDLRVVYVQQVRTFPLFVQKTIFVLEKQ